MEDLIHELKLTTLPQITIYLTKQISSGIANLPKTFDRVKVVNPFSFSFFFSRDICSMKIGLRVK